MGFLDGIARQAAVGRGGPGGSFQKQGLGDMVSSWISTGPDPAISVSQVADMPGEETTGQFAREAGVPVAAAGPVLAGMLPTAVDYLTPDGNMPSTESRERTLSSLLSRFGG